MEVVFTAALMSVSLWNHFYIVCVCVCVCVSCITHVVGTTCTACVCVDWSSICTVHTVATCLCLHWNYAGDYVCRGSETLMMCFFICSFILRLSTVDMSYAVMLFCLRVRGREVRPVLPRWVHAVSQGSQGSEESWLVSHLSPGCFLDNQSMKVNYLLRVLGPLSKTSASLTTQHWITCWTSVLHISQRAKCIRFFSPKMTTSYN